MADTEKNYASFWERTDPIPNIILADKNNQKASRIRRFFYNIFFGAPIFIYVAFNTYSCLVGIENISTLFSGKDVYEEIEQFWYFTVILQAFATLPFLVALYVIDWLPFFLSKKGRPFHDIIFGIHVTRGEKKPSSPLRTILKAPFILVRILCLFLLCYLTLWSAYNIPDRALNPEVEKFFYENDFTPENNVRAIWAGLHAPTETEDIYEYGLKVHKGEIDDTWHLRFEGEVNYDYSPNIDGERTLPPAGYVETLYENNKEIIERYTLAYNYKNYDAPSTLARYGSGQDVISIHRLLDLYWEYLAQNGQGEKAIKWWLNDMKLIQGMMGSNTTMVEKAVWMVNHSISRDALLLILKADPSLIEKYELQITEILNKDFMKDIWDVENTWRGEYSALRDMRISKLPHDLLSFKPNDTRNTFLEIAKDMIALSKRPAYEISTYEKQIIQKYECLQWPCFIFPYNIGGKFLLLSGFTKGTAMYANSHTSTTEQRGLILWMQAHKQNISPEEMEAFLQQAPKDLYDNLTGKPFRWDSDKNAIYLERQKDEPETRRYIYY